MSAPEAILVVQASPSGEVIIDTGLDVDIPHAQLHAMVERSRLFPVVVRNGEIVWAPGQRDLGRSRRLASADQRRMLRALYATCALPDCTAPFDRTRVHHLHDFADGGCTDLDNLVPICPHHHTRLHAERWQLNLGTGRRLTVTHADGTTTTSGPNRAPP